MRLVQLIIITVSVPLAGCQLPKVTARTTAYAVKSPVHHVSQESWIRHVAFRPDDGKTEDQQSKTHDKKGKRDESEDRSTVAVIPATEVNVAGLHSASDSDSLDALESLAMHANPKLRRLSHKAASLASRARHVGRLPDPTLGTNIFVSPIETAAGSQRANVSVMQMIPWLKRLQASEQKACLEAMVARKEFELERQRIVATVRVLWYRLFVINKQLEINAANQELLESLIKTANSRVASGKATQADVLLGTVEIGKLEQQRVVLRQQLQSTKAILNRSIGRDASTPIAGPKEIEVALPAWDQVTLFETALAAQPGIEASRLQQQAARWGVQLACNSRRPDVTVGVSWFAIDNNRPATNIVDVGQDALSLGISTTLPIRRRKYDAIQCEANHEFHASSAAIEDVTLQYDALIADLWQQAEAANRTIQLYSDTIIPQAKRSLEANQKSYATGRAEFDRLIQDYRSLLTLELQHHEARGRLATSIARIQEAIGIDLQ